jgi:flagellar hook protein FlgE
MGVSDTSLNPMGVSDTSLNPMVPSLNPMGVSDTSLNPMVPSLNPMGVSDTSLNMMVPSQRDPRDASLNPMGPIQRDQRDQRDPQKDAGNLMKGGDESNPTTTTIRPSICSMNRQSDGQLKTLNDEPGFVELMQLYLDDKYDYSTGEFTGMSDNTQAQFNRDLKAVYTEFTGNTTMPDTIKSFSDILLRDYGSLDGCVNGTYSKPYEINTNGTLMVQFANNTRQMIARASENQSKLLSVINILFVHSVKDGKPSVSVNPQLTDAILQKATEQARSLIIALYMSCEQDYVRGVKMYQAIVEAKLLQTGINQIHALRKDERELLKGLNEKKDLM